LRPSAPLSHARGTRRAPAQARLARRANFPMIVIVNQSKHTRVGSMVDCATPPHCRHATAVQRTGPGISAPSGAGKPLSSRYEFATWAGGKLDCPKATVVEGREEWSGASGSLGSTLRSGTGLARHIQGRRQPALSRPRYAHHESPTSHADGQAPNPTSPKLRPTPSNSSRCQNGTQEVGSSLAREQFISFEADSVPPVVSSNCAIHGRSRHGERKRRSSPSRPIEDEAVHNLRAIPPTHTNGQDARLR
jgi:hypothetical protein